MSATLTTEWPTVAPSPAESFTTPALGTPPANVIKRLTPGRARRYLRARWTCTPRGIVGVADHGPRRSLDAVALQALDRDLEDVRCFLARTLPGGSTTGPRSTPRSGFLRKQGTPWITVINSSRAPSR